MATKQIGKLKYNISKRGIAYKWGDGEIHRIAFQQPRKEPEDNYEAEQGYEPYDDGYDRPYDDGYQEGYDQDGYYEEGYDEQPYPAGFLFENDWVMWLALVVLPPLGIYILWKKQQFETHIRTGISAASAAWFILLLVLLFSGVFSGTDDIKHNQSDNIVQTTSTPAPTMRPTTAPTTAPTPTPAPTTRPDEGVTTGGTTTDTTGIGTANDPLVYADSLGQYYHKQSVCGTMSNGTPMVRSLAMHGRFSHLGPTRRPSSRDRDAVQHALERVGMAALADRDLRTLSGGQRQKAYLAMLIAQEAHHLL
ncbi:MAG: hypothetical protein Q4A66_06950, partial [Eubacteriales bacterium]|nr:hypothetical protein [Eubacteriales bacterium]